MLLEIRFIGNQFQGARNFCTCMTDHFAIISLLEFFFFRDTILEDVQFSSSIHFAVGPLEPSNPTHGNSEEEDLLAQTILMTHTRLCAQEKHKQRD